VSGRTHQISLVPLWHLLDKFQVGGAHHGFLDGQVGQQVVVLHDVARVLAERAQVTLLATHQDLALYITGSVNVGYIFVITFKELYYLINIMYKKAPSTVKVFKNLHIT